MYSFRSNVVSMTPARISQFVVSNQSKFVVSNQSNLHVPQIITHFSLDKTRVTITMPLFSGFPLFSLKKFPNFSSILGHFSQTFFPQWFKTTNDVHVYLMLYQTKYCTETRMHSSRMRTVRSLPYGWVSLTEIPLDRDPPKQTPRK